MATPSAFAGYIPALNGQMIVDYSRNPKDYAVNQIVQLNPVDKQQGYYLRFDPTAHSRILTRENRIWVDGQPRPISGTGKQEHVAVPYLTERFAESEPFGYLATEQAEWDIIKQHSNVLASRGMTFRTKEVYNALANTSNFDSSHVDTATNWGGGTWATATGANNYIQRTINAVANRILLDTNAVVQKSALTMIMSPTVAYAIAARPEIRDVFIQSQYGQALIEGNGSWNMNYGLPPMLYGVKVLVDPTLETTTNANVAGTATSGYINWTNSVAFVARKGDLTSTGDLGTVFSTMGLFVYKGGEMSITVEDERLHKRKWVCLEDHFQAQVIAPKTGALVTAVLS